MTHGILMNLLVLGETTADTPEEIRGATDQRIVKQ
jgi:hypothetical protein